MALAVIDRGTLASTTGASSYTLVLNATPAAGSVLYVWVVNSKGSAPNQPALSGVATTWTEVVTSVLFNGDLHRTSSWQGLGSFSGTDVTITTGGANQTGLSAAAQEWTGADTALPTNIATNTAVGGTSVVATLGSSPAASSAVAAGVGLDVNTATTAGAGFTQLNTATYNSPQTRISSEYDLASADTTADFTFAAADAGIIAFEVLEAVAAGGATQVNVITAGI